MITYIFFHRFCLFVFSTTAECLLLRSSLVRVCLLAHQNTGPGSSFSTPEWVLTWKLTCVTLVYETSDTDTIVFTSICWASYGF